ncbi:MAG: hypothetical protein HY788_06805 [Deltaproteobacteria bacterium]|nr:hypothetical protein [Deltaproteobacteria bacterium]
MSPALPIIDGVTGIVNKVVDHFLPASMSEEEKVKAKLEAGAMAQRMALEEKSAFRNFVLDYEGRAKEIPKTLVWLRSSIRPMLTYLIVGAYVCGWMGIRLPYTNMVFTPEHMELLKPALILVLGFWFGERLLTRSGLAEAIKGRKK